MDAPEHGWADHAPYIRAVRRGLEARDIAVAEMAVTISGDGRREATLLLRPVEDAFVERLPAEASASWDEDNGWSLAVRYESLTSHVHKGLDVAPEPEDMASWAVALLAHPELTPSRDDHPFRDHRVADPVFEVLLTAYSPAR
jgi:Family of unknown function (DUF6292)